MKLVIDRTADALYLKLTDAAPVESEEMAPGTVFDYDAAGHVVGVELLHLSRRVAREALSRVQLETIGV